MRNVLALMGTAALMLATPVLAEGKADRARQAIAEAQGKVQTLGSLGAAGDTPRMVAQAQAALRSAQDNLKGGNKDEAIADAHRASELADTAVNLSRQQAQNSLAVQDDVALQAQAAAAAADARAARAEQAASAAQADAAAARAAPPVVVAAPAPETTVTTETTRTAAPTRAAPRKTVTRVVKRKPAVRAATVTEKTTTTVRSN